MNGEYKIFKRNPDTGRRDTLIQRYKEFQLTLNWGEQSKFSIKGEQIGDIEIDSGDYLLFYRNDELLFSGLITEMSVNCDNVMTGQKSWSASGKDDNIIFSNRLIVPDPINMTFHKDYVDKCEDFAYNRLLYYIRRNMGGDATEERQIKGLIMPAMRSVGKWDVSSYRYTVLEGALEAIGSEEFEDDENGLYPQFRWNPDTGIKQIIIPFKRDMTDEVVLSPEFGNVTSWSKSSKMPKYNAIWVVSGDYESQEDELDWVVRNWIYRTDKELPNKLTLEEAVDKWIEEHPVIEDEDSETQERVRPTTRIWVYREDSESIAQYGRIEKLVTKSDIKVVYPKDDDEDKKKKNDSETSSKSKTLEEVVLAWIERRDSGNPKKKTLEETVRYWLKKHEDIDDEDEDEEEEEEETEEDEDEEDKVVTEEEARNLLDNEAVKLLKENAMTVKYKITMAETPDLQFMRDWKCGDLVTCVIDGDKFVSTIETVTITYSHGKEKIKPTVGSIEESEFSAIFKALEGIDTRMSMEELEKTTDDVIYYDMDLGE